MFGMAPPRVTVVIMTVLSALASGPVGAEPVSSERALRAAEGFLGARTPVAAKQRHTLSAAAKSRSPRALHAVTSDDGTVLAYVAALEPGGFIITSADTDITPIVAYSFQGAFDPAADRSSPLYLLLTQDLKLRLLAAQGQGATNAADNGEAWSLYESNRVAAQAVQQWPAENTTTTGGWVETTWHQFAPYNALCPLDPVDGERSVVGCAATAMAQLLNYHRRCAATFSSEDAYTTYGGVDVDSDSVRYGFPSFSQLNDLLSALRLKYSRQEPPDDSDAAVLSLACGFAAKMDYSSAGSGALPDEVMSALLDKFHLFSADMIGGLSSQSIQVVQENVTDRLPVLMGIRTPDGMAGHLIICDGYNTDGEYHLNFGWTSSRPAPIVDAWYRLPSDIPTTLSAISEVIVNVQTVPPSIGVDPARLDFVSTGATQESTKVLFIRNDTAEPIHVNSISCPPGFVASLGGDGAYSDRIGPFEIPHPGQEMAITVKFVPPTPGGYYGTLAVDYSDGKVRYVMLQGDAHVGGTEVPGGDVSGTWSAAGSPYYVLGDIQVAVAGSRSSQLTIEPGVRVIFMGHYGMTVGNGAKLIAQGTAAKPILFTAANTQLGFAGLRLVQTGGDDVLSYCTITYARKGAGLIDTDYSVRDLDGGALYCYRSSPTITHCIFANNVGDCGGAVFCSGGNPVISDTVIANNACMGGSPQAGGIYCTGDSNVQIDNCTIVNNSPGGLYSDATFETQVTGTILWGNRDYQILAYEAVATVSYCDVQGGYGRKDNLDADPAFFDPTPGIGADYDGAAANWTLKTNSPCINAGDPTVDGETDLAGNPRVCCGVSDIGAYENQSDLALMTTTPAARLDAGFVKINAAESVTLNIANTGKRDLTIAQVDVNDANGVFSLTHSIAGKVLAPGELVQVEIGFVPTKEKVFTGTLRLRSTADNASDRRFSIRGTGTAGTLVTGSVSGVWTKAASPYTVAGDIHIPAGESLTIEPGAVVRFAGPFSLTAGYKAALKAGGTEQESILFTPTDIAEGWLGLRFVDAGDDDVLEYCTLEYASKSYIGTSDWTAMYGGAILCCMGTDPSSQTPSSPQIDHCLIRHCYGQEGAAICCTDQSEAVISNNVIMDNTAEWHGGAILNYYANARITNNILAYNNAYLGGGVYSFIGVPTVVNNTIVHNRGAALYLDWTTYSLVPGASSQVSNNIIWENEIYVEPTVEPGEYAVRFNDIQGGWNGEGNLEVDPLFADPASRDYHLKSQTGRWDPRAGFWVTDGVTSPCIDAGDPAMAVGDEPAPNGGRIDMGAYGGTTQASKSQ
jgi:hypothetical protein